MSVLDIAAALVIILGLLIMAFGVLGLIILPDLFTRFHAATKCSLSGSILVLLGLALWSARADMVGKLALIAVFMIFTAPVTAHMLALSRMEDQAKGEDDDD